MKISSRFENGAKKHTKVRLALFRSNHLLASGTKSLAIQETAWGENAKIMRVVFTTPRVVVSSTLKFLSSIMQSSSVTSRCAHKEARSYQIMMRSFLTNAIRLNRSLRTISDCRLAIPRSTTHFANCSTREQTKGS